MHIDLVKGLDSKEIAVDFIKEYAGADGIISTKPFLIKRVSGLVKIPLIVGGLISDLTWATDLGTPAMPRRT